MSAAAITSSPSTCPHSSKPCSLTVDLLNSVQRRHTQANHQTVQFSVATNGNFTVASNKGYLLARCNFERALDHAYITDS